MYIRMSTQDGQNEKVLCNKGLTINIYVHTCTICVQQHNTSIIDIIIAT